MHQDCTLAVRFVYVLIARRWKGVAKCPSLETFPVSLRTGAYVLKETFFYEYFGNA